MYQVKRAIIMAAGVGSRMQPVTLQIPKPLVKVNGIRMIDTAVRGLQKKGINEIYVVVGYQKEKFEKWRKSCRQVRLIENPYYERCNNISSLYAARAYLEDVIILDGDQMIYNADVLDPCFECSGYNALWTDQPTDEWLMNVENGIVTHCSRSGGSHGWRLFSISRWNREDGARLRKHLETEFVIKKNDQIYWDDVALFCYPEEYQLGIRKMKPGDVLEIDSYEELAAIDAAYKKKEWWDMYNE